MTKVAINITTTEMNRSEPTSSKFGEQGGEEQIPMISKSRINFHAKNLPLLFPSPVPFPFPFPRTNNNQST
jgi:hypothetical protein